MRTIVVFFVALFIASPCDALELQAEYGQCRLGQSDDGDFWQSGKETHDYLTPRCASLGVAGRFRSFWNDTGASRWGWGIAFVVTGTFESRGNVATFRDDERHQTFAPSDCQDDGRGCMTRHHGSGDLKGFRFKVTRSIDLGRRWELIPEAGLLFHRIFWRNEAKWLDGEGPARHCTNAECRRIRLEELPGNYDQSEWKDVFRSAPALSLGAALRYRQVYAVIRRDLPLGGRPLSLTNGKVTELLTGFALPLN